MSHTEQSKKWGENFGHQYTDRNPQIPDEIDALYLRNFGFSRSSLNEEFLNDLNRNLRIMEAGTNVGAQIQLVQKMGFQNLYGIELQTYAIEKAKKLTRNINLIEGNVLDIPFKDNFFDLVYTSGVLIHISPDNILQAIQEIYRCSNCYIWGFEYFSENHTAIPYRGENDLLWKANFAEIYLRTFPDLEIVKEKRISYLESQNCDSMFLLKKAG